MRKWVCKGPKYHENKVADFIYAKNNIIEGIDKCWTSLSSKKGLPEALFKKSKNSVSECTEEKIAKLHFRNICPRKPHTLLQNKSVNKASKYLHHRYVITAIYKTTGKMAVVRKIFYALYFMTRFMINYWKFLMNWFTFALKEEIGNPYLLMITRLNGKKNEGLN